MLSAERPLLLASASPRRREMLARLGIPLWVRSITVDEEPRAGEAPERYLERVVDDKLAAAAALPDAARAGGLLVADTAVVQGACILGKPRDDADAAAMLARLQGARHEVLTRFALAAPNGAPLARATVRTAVWFRPLAAHDVAAYVACGEGRDKAGAYAVQGVGACLVERIEGSPSCVIGLPLCEVVQALERAGLIERCPLS